MHAVALNVAEQLGVGHSSDTAAQQQQLEVRRTHFHYSYKMGYNIKLNGPGNEVYD